MTSSIRLHRQARALRKAGVNAKASHLSFEGEVLCVNKSFSESDRASTAIGEVAAGNDLFDKCMIFLKNYNLEDAKYLANKAPNLHVMWYNDGQYNVITARR